MKKILFLMLIGFLTVACQHDITTYSEQELTEIKYNQAFEQTFGKISSNQTWGFKSSSVTRASYPNSNMWADEGYDVPEPLSQDEINKVARVFNRKGEEHYESLINWDCFFVQHVAGYHRNMDYLVAYDPAGHEETVYWEEYNWVPTIVTVHDDHIYNFNATEGSIMLMVNSSTANFGFHSSKDSKMHYRYRMEIIDGQYYVGFDFEEWDGTRNQVYNDWIIKIVPGKGGSDKIKERGRIICEDLGTVGDFDFNDIVFDAIVWESGKTEITLLAAGGTLDVSVAGVNVGEALGKMVNTGLSTVPTYYFVAENKYNSLIEIPVIVSKTDAAGNITSYALSANKGKAPQKICVPEGFKWCKEYKSLVDAYPGFKDWTTGSSDTWAGSYNSSLVYE